MARKVPLFALAGAFISALVLAEIYSYIGASDSNHTAFEPWLLVIVFVPTVVLGLLSLRRNSVVAGVLALLVGLAGIATLTYIDRTNSMLQYDRWLSRNMPLPSR